MLSFDENFVSSVTGLVLGYDVVLHFSEAMNVAVVPAAEDISVKYSGAAHATGSSVVWTDNQTLTVTLDQPFDEESGFTLDYVPGVSPIENAGGTPQAALADEVVTLSL